MFALTGHATPDYPATPADYSETPGFAHYSATPSYTVTRDILQKYTLSIKRIQNDLLALNKVMRNG